MCWALSLLNSPWRAQDRTDTADPQTFWLQMPSEMPSCSSNDRMISWGACQLLCGHEINSRGGEGAPGGGAPWDALGCLKEKWIYAGDNSWNRCETKYFISQSCLRPFWKGNGIAGLTCSSSDRALFLSKKIPWPGQIPFPATPLPTAVRGEPGRGGEAFLSAAGTGSTRRG